MSYIIYTRKKMARTIVEVLHNTIERHKMETMFNFDSTSDGQYYLSSFTRK